ncbi:MAG: hypothetical protein WDN44_08350 [Sphingomonas sp.]
MKNLVKSIFVSVGVALFAPPAAAQVLVPPPLPPIGSAPNQNIPERDSLGRYATPNLGLSRDEVVWHLRAALNVAALACRDAEEERTITAYNRMIAEDAAPLAAADAAVKADYRARYGVDWADRHDHDMTKLYNFFAQPPAQGGFCAAAQGVLAEIDRVPPAELADFAAEALPRLEAPFTDFYRDYDRYRLALAAWNAQAMPGRAGMGLAAAAPTQQTASIAGLAMP